MKIEIIKESFFSGKLFKVGIKAQVETGLGQSLVDTGHAISSEYVTEREVYAESISIEKAVEVIDEMPRKAKDIIKKIKTTTNKPALELLLTDGRDTVREAAQTRLEEL